jgi:hypothetical protein
MPADLGTFRERAACAAAKADCAAGDADHAVIAEFAKPTDAMIDSAYEAVRFDEAWAINSRRDFSKAVRAMVQTARQKQGRNG